MWPLTSFLIINTLILYTRCHVISFADLEDFLETYMVIPKMSPSCARELQEFKVDLVEPDAINPWAIKMLDSSSKLHAGLLPLNLGEIGNFQQCISTRVIASEYGAFKPKYCLGRVKIPFDELKQYRQFLDKRIMQQIEVKNIAAIFTNLIAINATKIAGPTFAVCVPDSCDMRDLNYLINAGLKVLFKTNMKVEFDEAFCQTEYEAEPEYTTGAIITLTIFVAYICFITSITAYEYVMTSIYNRNVDHEWIVGFSFIQNTKKLFTPVPSSGHYIGCLDSIKFFSIIWVVLGHQYSISATGPLINTIDIVEWADSLLSMTIVNSTFAGDTFLLISAALTIMQYMRTRRDHRNIGFFKYLTHRYLRISPQFIALIIFAAVFIRYMGSGPQYPLIQEYFVDNCVKNWWLSLMFIQNYANQSEVCIGHSWYLAIDMQMHVIGFLLCCAIYRWKYPTIIFCIFGVILSSAAAFIAAWNNELTAILTNINGDHFAYKNYYYILTHTRAAPWFIGFIFGYYIFTIKNNQARFEIGVVYATCAWILSIAAALFCIFIGHDMLRREAYSTWGNALYIAFIRPIWAMCIAWIILACLTDNSKMTTIVKSILNLSVFSVLNRFTYTIYLMHVVVICIVTLSIKTPEYFSTTEMLLKFCGNLCVTLFVSYIWILLFYLPMKPIEISLFQKIDQLKNYFPKLNMCFPEDRLDRSGDIEEELEYGLEISPSSGSRSEHYEEISLRSRKFESRYAGESSSEVTRL